MVGHAIDAKCDSSEFAHDASGIGVKISLDLLRNEERAIRRTEDEMDQDVGRGVAHVLTPLRG